MIPAGAHLETYSCLRAIAVLVLTHTRARALPIEKLGDIWFTEPLRARALNSMQVIKTESVYCEDPHALENAQNQVS